MRYLAVTLSLYIDFVCLLRPVAAVVSASSSATDSSGNVYRAFYNQVTNNNQDAWVEKVTSGGDELWSQSYESAPPDSRGVLAVVDDLDRPWIVFTVDGGSNDAGAIHKKQAESSAFSGVLAGGYGSGGGPKVSVITRLDPSSGAIVKGTYFYAVLSNGNTNSLEVQTIGVDTQRDRLQLWTKSAAWPVGVGSGMVRNSALQDSDRVDGAFYMYYELSTSMDQIEVAELRTSAEVITPVTTTTLSSDNGGSVISTTTAAPTGNSTSVLDNTEVGLCRQKCTAAWCSMLLALLLSSYAG